MRRYPDPVQNAGRFQPAVAVQNEHVTTNHWGRPLGKIRPSACQSRISMRWVAPDLRPVRGDVDNGMLLDGRGELSPWRCPFWGAMSMRRAHDAG